MQDEDYIVTAKYRDGSKLKIDLRMEYLSYYLGEYEPANLKILLSFFPKDGVFIDIGANIGFFSIPVAHRRRTACRVYAFEPIAANYEALIKNIELNGLEEEIFPINLAASNLNGRVSMQITTGNRRRTSNAIVLTSWKGFFNHYLYCEVEAVRFDDWMKSRNISRIDVVKIDVEGHEYHTLEGMLDTLQKYRPVIYAECNSFFLKKQNLTIHQILGLLSPFDYDYYQIRDGKLEKITKFSDYMQDIFFIPK